MQWYLISMIIGVGLLLITAFFGGGEMDADVDGAVDIDGGDVDIDTTVPTVDHPYLGESGSHSVGKDFAWLPFLSLRFWTYFLAAFGLTGMVLSLFTGTVEPLRLILSAGNGLFIGALGFYIFRTLSNMQGEGSISRSMAGVEGTVTVASRDGHPGKVRVHVDGDTIDVLALSSKDSDLNRGEKVVIVDAESKVVRVLRPDEMFEENKNA